MVRKVIHSDRSRDDLKGVCDYVAGENREAALKLGHELLDRIDGLVHFPGTGHLHCRSSEGEILSVPCRGYRIFYRVSVCGQNLEVLHIRHGARDEPEFE